MTSVELRAITEPSRTAKVRILFELAIFFSSLFVGLNRCFVGRRSYSVYGFPRRNPDMELKNSQLQVPRRPGRKTVADEPIWRVGAGGETAM